MHAAWNEATVLRQDGQDSLALRNAIAIAAAATDRLTDCKTQGLPQPGLSVSSSLPLVSGGYTWRETEPGTVPE